MISSFNRLPVHVAILILALPCILSAAPIALQATKPAPQQEPPPLGMLKVFTDTEEFNDGDILYYPHTSYTVRRTDGSTFQRVRNHIGPDDSKPTLLRLPEGSYLITARASGAFDLKIPVTIKPRSLLLIYLESDWKSLMQKLSGIKLVKAPSGEIMGWMMQISADKAVPKSKS